MEALSKTFGMNLVAQGPERIRDLLLRNIIYFALSITIAVWSEDKVVDNITRVLYIVYLYRVFMIAIEALSRAMYLESFIKHAVIRDEEGRMAKLNDVRTHYDRDRHMIDLTGITIDYESNGTHIITPTAQEQYGRSKA